MTLKEYTNFVFVFSRDLKAIHSLQAGQIRTAAISSLQDLLNQALQILMGYANWEEFAAFFYEKSGYNEDFKREKNISVAHIYKSQEIFWPALAEFCEPLIKKTVQKPEGGQDAAKV